MPLTSHASACNIERVMASVLIAQQANTACALNDMQKIDDLCVCVCGGGGEREKRNQFNVMLWDAGTKEIHDTYTYE